MQMLLGLMLLGLISLLGDPTNFIPLIGYKFL